METPEKKILRIRKGEYLLAMEVNGIATTYNKDSAMDISNWSLEQLGMILSNLKRVGYKKATIEVIEKSVKEDILERTDNSIRKLLDNDRYNRLAVDEDSRKAKEQLSRTVNQGRK